MGDWSEESGQSIFRNDMEQGSRVTGCSKQWVHLNDHVPISYRHLYGAFDNLCIVGSVCRDRPSCYRRQKTY